MKTSLSNLRNSKNFDYVTIHQPENLKLSKLYIFKLKKFKEYQNRDFQILRWSYFFLYYLFIKKIKLFFILMELFHQN